MGIDSIKRALTGKDFIHALTEKSERKAIAENLLYELTTLMVAADPGTGKSTVSAQAVVELAAGLPVFGYFPVKEPTKVFYIQSERPIMELLERFKILQKTYPIMEKNIIVTDAYQVLNLLNTVDVKTFMECLERDAGGAKVWVIDPIYSTVGGGLKEDKPASAFTKVMSLVQQQFGCTLWYNHHTTKDIYHAGKKVEKEDPFYGSQWLKAHVTGSYYMKRTSDGVTMICKKDNYGVLANRIPLEFDPETGLCSVLDSDLTAIDKLRNFLKVKAIDRKTFYFKDIEKATGLCTRTIRGLFMHSSISPLLELVSNYKNKNLYKIREGG